MYFLDMRRILSILIITALLATSCTQSDTAGLSSDGYGHNHTLSLCLNASKPSFESGSRADGSQWNSGDVITLSFDNGVSGTATYDASSRLWEVSYTGSFDVKQSGMVVVGFFGSSSSISGGVVTLDPHTDYYIATDASYVYSNADGTVSISASLQPTIGRIRFKGEAGRQIVLSGLKWLQSFVISNGIDNPRAMGDVSITVANDGFTPYTYCTFPGEDYSLSIRDNDAVYTITLLENVLTPGRSGVLSLPTSGSPLGWEIQPLSHQ